jgi:pimeloyl-ACP methyl ester carboxylesterase
MPSGPGDEVEALGRLAGEVADRLAAAPAQTLHAAIAARAFQAAGPAAAPVQAIHDAIADAAYASVRTGVRAGARLAAAAIGRSGRVTDPKAVSSSRPGAALVAVANGLVGHELALSGDPLAIELGFWEEGEPLAPTPEALAAALPCATPRLVVFVHGLFETERSWHSGAGEPYGDRLRVEAGWTPLHVRYNSGEAVADTGRALSELLAATAAAWPTRLDRIALVGHSMGGLVARSAAHGAREAGEPWADRLSHLACLGTPHRGSPVEQAVHGAAALLGRVPEAAGLGGVLEHRSAGIRDLRRGIEAGPLLEDVHHLFVAATLTADPRHPLGLALGDLLVRPGSACGPDGCTVRDEDVAVVGGAHHFGLLNHPVVHARLRDLLAREPAWAAPGLARRALPAGQAPSGGSTSSISSKTPLMSTASS